MAISREETVVHPHIHTHTHARCNDQLLAAKKDVSTVVTMATESLPSK